MGIFNYIDTFFFISLGITFILILLLVFHFKQRMTASEQKNDTMFEIINNIVQEITTIKNSVIEQTTCVFKNPMNMMHGSNSCCLRSNDFVEQPVRLSTASSPSDSQPVFAANKIVVSDSDEEEEDDDEDSEDEDSEEEDEDEDDEDSEEEDEEPTQGGVKIINVDIGETIEVNEILSDLDQEQDNNEEPETNMDNIDITAENSIQVEKLETVEPVVEETNLETIDTKTENARDIYGKMSLPQLRAAVITKGLSSDPSKMKKLALIKLLETNAEE
jgi:hypothetical protein